MSHLSIGKEKLLEELKDLPLLNNRYNIQKILGEGGMGRVYMAQDINTKEFVAVKECFVKKENSEIIERIKREYYFMQKITHPSLIKAKDFFCIQNRYFIIMEYIEGITLAQAIKNTNLNVGIKLQISKHICHAISALNNNGIVHRDLKPANIILTKNYLPKILDLGIAKSVNRELNTLTKTDNLIGTPEYMSPEQFQGEVKNNTDVFSLGVVLYQFFANMDYSPFYGGTMVSSMYKIMNDELPLLNTIIADDSPQSLLVTNILQLALQKDSGKRISSTEEMFRMLNQEIPITEIPPPIQKLSVPPNNIPAIDKRPTSVSNTTKNIKRIRNSRTTRISSTRIAKEKTKNDVKINRSVLVSIIFLNIIIIFLVSYMVFSQRNRDSTNVNNIDPNQNSVNQENNIINTNSTNENKGKRKKDGIEKILDIYKSVLPNISVKEGESIENIQLVRKSMKFLRNDRDDYYDFMEELAPEKLLQPKKDEIQIILSSNELLYLLGRRLRKNWPVIAEKLFSLCLLVSIDKIKKDVLVNQNIKYVLGEDLEDIYHRIGACKERQLKTKEAILFYKCSLSTAEVVLDTFGEHYLDSSKMKEMRVYFKYHNILDQELDQQIFKLRDN